MTRVKSEEVSQILRAASKQPLIPPTGLAGEVILDREAVESVLPHRDPFLFIDQVTQLDFEKGTIVARYNLSRAQDVFAGHFLYRPVWPGVLQVEAIGQAGIFLVLKRDGVVEPVRVALTHIISARFIRPITPGAEVEIQAKVLDDGLFFTVAGQCLQDGRICSVAAINNIYEGGD